MERIRRSGEPLTAQVGVDRIALTLDLDAEPACLTQERARAKVEWDGEQAVADGDRGRDGTPLSWSKTSSATGKSVIASVP
jgi:hypothetical protein